MRLFDRFDKVFCINLDRRPDRMLHFEEQVKKYNLGEFERVSAVDGLNLKNLRSKNLKSNEQALIETNLKILEKSQLNNYKKILILEDDCTFYDEVQYLDLYFEKLPEDWDMLYMGGNHNTHVGVNPPKKINDKVQKLSHTYSTHFVGISNKVFEDLLFILNITTSPLDVTYTDLQKRKNVYSFYPAIVTQKVGYSDIQNTVTDYNWLIK